MNFLKTLFTYWSDAESVEARLVGVDGAAQQVVYSTSQFLEPLSRGSSFIFNFSWNSDFKHV